LTDLQPSNTVRLLIAGYVAAGRAYAVGFHQAGADVTAMDPFADGESQKTALAAGIVLDTKLPDDLGPFDLVIILSPAAATLGIIRELAARTGTCPVLDLTSSAPGAMQEGALILGERFIDGTVLGAVGLGGLATPMVFAGKQAETAAAMLRPLGCRISCIDGAPGSASQLKLLRSLFMKGLEALFVETRLAAAALGQTDGLSIALADLADIDMPAFLDEMLRTHPKHAGRRTHEVAAVEEMMQEAGFTSYMLPATRQMFTRTAAAGTGPDISPEEALSWLSLNFTPQTEDADAKA